MSDTKYAYAVARIRAMELSLFSSSTLDQLMALKTYESCLQFLTEKGWGDQDTGMDAEAILTREKEKTWNVVRDLLKKEDAGIINVLSYENLFHNLKAAIKETVTSDHHGNIYFDNCAIGGKEMARIVAERDWQALPANMRAAAEEAYETFLHTRDGQLCDIIIDRAALEAIYAEGEKAADPVIRAYAESTVAVADIKIAVRSQKTAKNMDFMKRAMVECESLSVAQLSKAAVNGIDAIVEYLSGTAYAEGGKAIAESMSAFERWCANRMMQPMQPQKYQSFSVGPLVAYVLARENEIKTVRIILSGKRSGLSDDSIRERVREMYV